MTEKPTNPKDAVGIRKARWFSFLPIRALQGVGLAMLEGARKYGRHNYREAGVRASVYVDAAVCGHLTPWWEGEDLDPDSGLSHIDKAIASLLVLRDSMLQGNWVDDRPVKAEGLQAEKKEGDAKAGKIIDSIPEPKEPFLAKPAQQSTLAVCLECVTVPFCVVGNYCATRRVPL